MYITWLIADDHAVVRAGLRQYLEESGRVATSPRPGRVESFILYHGISCGGPKPSSS